MRETLREKMNRIGQLKRLQGVDKVAFGMLSIATIINAIIYIVAVVLSMYAIVVGLGDSNGGGWLIFIVMLLWIGYAPILIVDGLQIVLWKLGVDKAMKGQRKEGRSMWLVSGIIGASISAFLLYLVWYSEETGGTFWIVAAIVIYFIVVVALFVIRMIKSKNDMSKQYKAVLFDFDYTLGDSTDGIAQSVMFALEQLGEQPQELENIRKTIGMTLKEAYRTLTGNMDEERAKLFDQYFRQKADEVMVAGTSLYEPTRMVLESLHAQGCKIGIVTTKGHRRIESILEKFGMSHLVDVIVGGDDVKKQKPAPDGLFRAMKSLGIADEEILYVGDTVIDAKAAKSAGVDFGAVLTGTTEEIGFVTYPKKVVAKDLYGLMQFLRDENKIWTEYKR